MAAAIWPVQTVLLQHPGNLKRRIQAVPEAADAAAGDLYFEELQHLIVAFPTWTGAPADTEMVTEKVNEILREKYNIEVEFQISDSGSYKQNMTLALSSGETD